MNSLNLLDLDEEAIERATRSAEETHAWMATNLPTDLHRFAREDNA